MSKNKNPIPIKNLFYMLCYAWDVLDIADTVKLQEEDMDDAYNLLTRLLIYGVSKLIRRGFHRTYVDEVDDLTCIRGKIEINDTIKLRCQNINKCTCEYDEFLKDNIFNGIIKKTISDLMHNQNIDNRLIKELRPLLVYFNDITPVVPNRFNLSKLKFNANNKHYKMLLHICIMLHEGTMVNEEDGSKVFKDFYREEQMQKVYEKFLLNFYKMHLDKSVYHVSATKLDWQLDDDEEDYDYDLLPEMRTDIVIENKRDNIQFIVDAKYYKEALIRSYYGNDKEFRSAHMYQMTSYLVNSKFAGKKLGALIYPSVKYDINKSIPTKYGHMIFKTIDLSMDWKNIEKDLLEFAKHANK